jgi:hypothetical protein
MRATVTKILMLVAALALIGWDLYAFLTPFPGDTVSEVHANWAWDWPSLPLAWGVVMGHLFWHVDRVSYETLRWCLLGVVGVAAFIVDILWLDGVLPMLPFLVGLVLGRLLWPMRRPQLRA